jgi:hypothetical protein
MKNDLETQDGDKQVLEKELEPVRALINSFSSYYDRNEVFTEVLMPNVDREYFRFRGWCRANDDGTPMTLKQRIAAYKIVTIYKAIVDACIAWSVSEKEKHEVSAAKIQGHTLVVLEMAKTNIRDIPYSRMSGLASEMIRHMEEGITENFGSEEGPKPKEKMN